MEAVKKILESAILSIEKTTELLYQQKKTEGYNELDDTLKILIQLVNSIAGLKKEGQEIPINENELVRVLTEAMKAMEEKDEVLLSDILEYELKDMLLELKKTID